MSQDAKRAKPSHPLSRPVWQLPLICLIASDTNIPDLAGEPKFEFKDQYGMTARSLLLLRPEMWR
jgi:hypothetical protein